MEPEIVTIQQRKLIGKRLTMNFAENRTAELWRAFMPHRKSIDAKRDELFSAAIYPDGFFERFEAMATFEKWAAAESDGAIPEGMETFVIPPGQYAVFRYKGSSAEAPKVFDYILNTWLPNSEYRLDNRPHFEILGQQYKNADPDSEEDIYIPIKRTIE